MKHRLLGECQALQLEGDPPPPKVLGMGHCRPPASFGWGGAAPHDKLFPPGALRFGCFELSISKEGNKNLFGITYCRICSSAQHKGE